MHIWNDHSIRAVILIISIAYVHINVPSYQCSKLYKSIFIYFVPLINVMQKKSLNNYYIEVSESTCPEKKELTFSGCQYILATEGNV